MSATVSASPGKAAEEADPLVENGLSEASMTTVVLPYITTAREGVQRIADIVDKYGSAEGNIIFIADDKESWYMEIYTGHQYAAVKVPDDMYAVVPNCFLLGYVDTASKDVIASKDLINLPKSKGFYKEVDGKFHAALTYGEEMSDYNRVRLWEDKINSHRPLRSLTTPNYSLCGERPIRRLRSKMSWNCSATAMKIPIKMQIYRKTQEFAQSVHRLLWNAISFR